MVQHLPSALAVRALLCHYACGFDACKKGGFYARMYHEQARWYKEG